MFRSSEAAKIVIAQPWVQSTNVAGGEITYGLPGGGFGATVIKPDGSTQWSGLLSALPVSGVSLDVNDYSFVLSLDPSIVVAGVWTASVSGLGANTNALPQTGSCQWGGTIDLLCQGAEDAAVAKQNSGKSAKIGGNRFEVDAGTGIGTLYDDDGTTPMATRTVQNGDGSPLSEAQVLKLGMFA